VRLTDPVRERSQAPRLETFEAQILVVYDGDTLGIRPDGREATRVRLQGIDCPEQDQDFGPAAKQFTEDQVGGRRVTVLPLGDDSHGRLLARVYVDGEDLSRALVRAGLAWHFSKYSHDQHLAAEERLAREARRGLWIQGDAIAPWEFRRQSESAEPARLTGLRGNTRSLLYHRPDCPQAGCPRCRRRFATEAEAREAGFRPAGCCFGAAHQRH
jgi:endonuclease YncB( thermonuclease family)